MSLCRLQILEQMSALGHQWGHSGVNFGDEVMGHFRRT